MIEVIAGLVGGVILTAGALIVFQTVMFVFIDAAQFIWDAFND
jgi:hypothetical protein